MNFFTGWQLFFGNKKSAGEPAQKGMTMLIYCCVTQEIRVITLRPKARLRQGGQPMTQSSELALRLDAHNVINAVDDFCSFGFVLKAREVVIP